MTEIGMAAGMKKKLSLDIPLHRLLGTCHPHLAHRAPKAEPQIAALLPFKLVMRSDAAAHTAVEYAWKKWCLPRTRGLAAVLVRHARVAASNARDVALQLGNESWSTRMADEQPRSGDTAVVIGADSLVLCARRAAMGTRHAGAPARGHESSLAFQPRSER